MRFTRIVSRLTSAAVLSRIVAHNGVVYYASPLLNDLQIPHAFTTRTGGVSSGSYRSLNFGNPIDANVPDSAENLAENLTRLKRAIDQVGHRSVRSIRQVHGADVVESDRTAIDSATCGDAIITGDENELLAIRTADCVPILFATQDGRTVAAVHAGWKGIIANVIGSTIAKLRTRSNQPFIAAIGPCISKESFEVGNEVLKAFEQHFAERDGPFSDHRNHLTSRNGLTNKPHIDLRIAARMQLLQGGLSDDQIDTTDRCTVRDADQFFSHRRDRGDTGRMISLIGPAR